MSRTETAQARQRRNGEAYGCCSSEAMHRLRGEEAGQSLVNRGRGRRRERAATAQAQQRRMMDQGRRRVGTGSRVRGQPCTGDLDMRALTLRRRLLSKSLYCQHQRCVASPHFQACLLMLLSVSPCASLVCSPEATVAVPQPHLPHEQLQSRFISTGRDTALRRDAAARLSESCQIDVALIAPISHHILQPVFDSLCIKVPC
jgi:hypothetical protein